MKKILLTVLFVVLFAEVAISGNLVKNEVGNFYIQDDGIIARSMWVWIDTDSDGSEECYYFDKDGKMTINSTTEDGYQVNEKGQWVDNGIVQKKYKQVQNNSGLSNSYSDSLVDAYNKGLDLGADAVNQGIDLGKDMVNDIADSYGNMFGGIFKDAAEEYKKEYSKAAEDYKKEYSKAMDEYKSELKSYMNDYSKQLGNLFSGFGY